MSSEESKYKKLSDFPVYERNPSEILEEDLGTNNFVTKGEVKSLVTKEGTEVLVQELGHSKSFTVDKREYRKLYVRRLREVKDLSNAGLKLLCYILMNLKPKKSEVEIDIDQAMEYTGYETKVNIYRGISELLDKKFIYRKVGNGVYFIDVNSFFNGSRL